MLDSLRWQEFATYASFGNINYCVVFPPNNIFYIESCGIWLAKKG